MSRLSPFKIPEAEARLFAVGRITRRMLLGLKQRAEALRAAAMVETRGNQRSAA
jgi:hypothetical protein